MALMDVITIAIILIVIAVFVIAYLELKYLRKSMRGRRVRSARRVEGLQDDAHNTIVTTKAIAATMERNGVHSEEAVALISEAQKAYDRRNYRVVLDLTSQAKEKLMAMKARQASQGDLAKLDTMPAEGSAQDTTTKELLQKEFPPNYAPAKFSLDLAQSSIDRGRSAGRDVSQAESLLVTARTRFDAKDYSGALASARLAQKSAEGERVSVPAPAAPQPSAVVTVLACATCGASLQSDDLFCRKCGTRVGPNACPSCGADLLVGDGFCRKCGASVSR